MRWVTYRAPDDNADRIGVVVGDWIHPVHAGTASLLELISAGVDAWPATGEAAKASTSNRVPIEDVKLRPPIPRPLSFREFAAFEGHLKTMRGARGAVRGKLAFACSRQAEPGRLLLRS